jgi:hypothetical protein
MFYSASLESLRLADRLSQGCTPPTKTRDIAGVVVGVFLFRAITQSQRAKRSNNSIDPS